MGLDESAPLGSCAHPDEPLHHLELLRIWYFLPEWGTLQALGAEIVAVLKLMKSVFDGYSKSEWRFVKFHIVLHCPEQIRQYGSLLIMDAGRWEETHAHFAKVGEQHVRGDYST